MMRELAPADLREKLRIAPPRPGPAAFPRSRFQRMPDLARTDFAKMQMRRKSRRAGEVGTIPLLRVVRERPRQKPFQIFPRSRFARRPHGAKPLCPVQLRCKIQLGERER